MTRRNDRSADELDSVETRIAWKSAKQNSPLGFTAGMASTGDGAREAIALPDEAHIMTIAPTGAGKTVNCIVPVLLQYPGSMIVLDPKGEAAIITARRRREMGHKVLIIDPMRVTGLPSSSFNPLDLVEPDSAEAADDARALAGWLMPAEFDSRDVFWRNRAMHLIGAAILNAVTDYLPEARNLVTVRDILHRMTRGAVRAPDGSPAKQAGHILSRHPDVARVNDMLDFGAPETLGGMFHTALEGVGFVRGPLIEQSLSHSDFSLDEITEGAPVTIHLVLPGQYTPSHGILLKLWLGTLFAAVMRRRGRPKLPTLLLLDEAALLGPAFQPLRTAITLLRGYGLQTWSFWQDLSQLSQLYPNDWRSMVNNCRIVQCFGAHSETAWHELGTLLGADLRGLGPIDRSTMLIQRDGVVELAERIDYRTDPQMRGQFDPNPIYTQQSGPLRRPRAMVENSLLAPAPGAGGETFGFAEIAAKLTALR